MSKRERQLMRYRWRTMIQRCHNPNSNGYYLYGSRGIKVCERWRTSFEAFCEDMGARPSPSHTIDRIDNDGNYEPGNVRWGTKKQQSTNSRRNITATINGETLCMTDWCRKLGVSYACVQTRVTRRGWDLKRALFTPPQSPNRANGRFAKPVYPTPKGADDE
jgi:hypothetical protein